MCCCSTHCNPHLGAFTHFAILQLLHTLWCLLCTGGAASPKAPFGVIKERLGIWRSTYSIAWLYIKWLYLLLVWAGGLWRNIYVFTWVKEGQGGLYFVVGSLPSPPWTIAHVKLPGLHRTALTENLTEEEAPFRDLIETEQLQAVYIVPSALFCFMARNAASLHGEKSEMLLT